jgi:hypothetical protein
MNPKPIARIEIILLDNGSVTLNETSPNKIISYGLLEQAKILLGVQQTKAQEESGIEVPPAGLVNRLNGR